MKTENRLQRVLKGAVAVLAAGIVLGLAAGVVLLYVRGNAAVAAGTQERVFSRAAAASFLKPFLIPALLLAVLLVLSSLLGVRAKETKPFLPAETAAAMKRRESVCAHRGMSRRGYGIVFAVILLLIAAGILNGGVRDVLIKAVRICTECIGLG